MNTTKNFLRSSAARTAFTVLYAAMAFFFMPFLVKHLGERWYGIWILITGIVASSYLLDMGITTAVMRYVAKHLAEKNARGANEVINTCLAIYTVLAGVIVLITLVLAAFAQDFVKGADDLQIVRAVIILIGLQYAAEFPFKAFSGIVSTYLRYDLLMLSRLLNVTLATGLMIYFVGRGYGILSMAIIVLAVDQLTNYLYYRIAKHLYPQLALGRQYLKRSLVKELFSYSSWSFVIQMANQLRFRTDSFVIGWAINATAVTHYAVGLRLVEYFADFVMKATNMMTPVFTRYYFEKNYEEIRKKYLFLTRVNVALGMFGGGMLIILGKAFILRWMGPSFEASYPVMVVLACAMTVEVIGIYADNILYALSKHHYLAVINVIEAVLNLALSLALAKPLGILGVALGTAIPLVVFRIFVIPLYVGRFIELSLWRFYRDLFKLVAFTLAYLAAFWFLTRPLLEVPSYLTIILLGCAAVPLYLLLVPYIGFSAEEKATLQQALPHRVQRYSALLLRTG